MEGILKLGFTEQELKDKKTVCEKCNGKLFSKHKILGVEKLLPVMCKCRQEELKRIEQDEERARIKRYLEELVANDLMSKRHTEYTFENDRYPQTNISKTCRKYVENWKQVKNDNIGLLLTGATGQGKTFYACCIANALVKQNYKVAITTIPKILAKLTKFSEENDKLVQRMKEVHLLVIDDFGVERKTEFATEQIFTLIDDRLNLGLPTIITTNIDFTQWDTSENITEQRLKDRILAMCPVRMLVKADGQSLRKTIASDKANKFVSYLQ